MGLLLGGPRAVYKRFICRSMLCARIKRVIGGQYQWCHLGGRGVKGYAYELISGFELSSVMIAASSWALEGALRRNAIRQGTAPI